MSADWPMIGTGAVAAFLGAYAFLGRGSSPRSLLNTTDNQLVDLERQRSLQSKSPLKRTLETKPLVPLVL